MKSPIGNRLPWTVKSIAEKSGLPTMAAINGVIKSLTGALNDRTKRSAHHDRDGEIENVSP